MKRTVVLTFLALCLAVASTVVTLPKTAGADTTAPSGITASCAPASRALSNDPPNQLTEVPRTSGSACQEDGVGHMSPDVTVSFGWEIYVHLSHTNVGEAIYYAAFVGWGATLAALCGVIGSIDLIAGAFCGVMVAELGFFVPAIMDHAWTTKNNNQKSVVFTNVYLTNIFGFFYAPDSWT